MKKCDEMSDYKVGNDLNSFMAEAIRQAEVSFGEDEVPVGAVIEYKGQIIAAAHNMVEKEQDASCHAEIIVLKEAAKKLNTWRLNECTLYVTLEPCAMCAGAAVNFRVNAIVFGAFDKRFGACGSAMDVTDGAMMNKVKVIGGVMEDECSKLLSDYFKAKRTN